MKKKKYLSTMENNNQQSTTNVSANVPRQSSPFASGHTSYKRTPSSARERIAAKIANTKGVGVKARRVM